MRTGRKLRERLTYANVMATIAVFVALGGGAYATTQLPKNSVGPKQLRKNAVTKAKIRKNSVVTAKIKANAVTGVKVKESTLGTVPSAQVANTANAASTASAAGVADRAGVAASLDPPEGWHEVGAPGEPAFLNGWGNAVTKKGPPPETAAFFRDHEGVVHLKGIVSGPVEGSVVFVLPSGYRPAAGRFLSPSGGELQIFGSETGQDGAVVADPKPTSLDGVTFRAES